MVTCKNCKYWKRSILYKFEYPSNHQIEYTDRPDCFGFQCLGIIESKFGECQHPKIKYNDTGTHIQREQLTPDLLLYEDSDCFNVWLTIGEDFGCVHFEEKQ